jgi:hypothetical protein
MLLIGQQDSYIRGMLHVTMLIVGHHESTFKMRLISQHESALPQVASHWSIRIRPQLAAIPDK